MIKYFKLIKKFYLLNQLEKELENSLNHCLKFQEVANDPKIYKELLGIEKLLYLCRNKTDSIRDYLTYYFK